MLSYARAVLSASVRISVTRWYWSSQN